MKKSLKIGLGSLVFLFVFIAFTNTADASYEVGRKTTKSGIDLGDECKVEITLMTAYGLITTEYTGSWSYNNVEGFNYCKIPGGIFKNPTVVNGIRFDPSVNKEQIFGVNKLPSFGDKRSDSVFLMQLVLAKEGMIKAIDSSFGPTTKASLVKFQAKYKLPATGKFDQATKDLMTQKLQSFSGTTGAPAPQIPSTAN